MQLQSILSSIQIFIRCTKGMLEQDLLELQRHAVKKIAAPVPALPQLCVGVSHLRASFCICQLLNFLLRAV
jgi:hypothetical protein